ncbi:MAG TPA: hypothetical protein PLK41_04570 [Defluviitoga tunisiensis]|nr:hypothetical protein [bacterium]HPP10245.1 hypothetical protein [Defluviitoga tunisiensis]
MAIVLNNQILQKFALEYKPAEFKLGADRILTKIPVNITGGTFIIKPQFVPEYLDSTAGVYSESPTFRPEIKISTGTYETKTHRLKVPILEEEVENMNEIGMTDFAIEKLKEIKTSLLLEEEYQVAQILSSTSNKTTPSIKWDGNSPTIEKDIQKAIDAFKDQAGIYPNKMIIPQVVWNVIMMDATLRELFKLIPARKEQDLDVTLIFNQRWNFLQEIIIVDASIKLTKKGNATDIWSDNVYLIYSVPNGTKSTFSAIGKFIKKDWEVKRVKKEDPEGEDIILISQYDIQALCPNAVYKLENVLT